MIVYALLFMLCVVPVLSAWWYGRPPRYAPGPRGFPLVGVLLKMTTSPHLLFYKWSKSYGPVMNVRVGRQDWVILSEVGVIKEALIKQGNKINGRPANYFTDVILSGGRRGIFFTDGKIWKKQKCFGVAAFRKLGIGRKAFSNIIRDEGNYLVNSLSSNEVDQPCDCKQAFMDATSNVMYAVLHGHRLEYHDKKFTKLTEFANLFTLDPERTKTANAIIFCPALRFLPPFRAEVARGLKNRTIAEEYLRSELKNASSKRKVGDPARGFVDAFLDETSRDGDAALFNEMQLTYYMRDLLLGGIESTTVSLLWCVLAAARFSKWQKKIQHEIDCVFTEIEVDSDHQQHMPHTMAFIQEVQRCCTVAPLALPHLAVEDANVGGFVVPKGTTVIVNLWAAHRDANVFEDPHEFRPERFINSDGRFVKSENVIPFATGARSCIGEQLAKKVTFIFLVSVLKRFQISIAESGGLPSLNDGVLSTTNMPKPFKVFLEIRRPDDRKYS